MNHWLLEGLLRPDNVAEESEDSGSEESSNEEVDFEARVSELEEELRTVGGAPAGRSGGAPEGMGGSAPRPHCRKSGGGLTSQPPGQQLNS